MNIITIKNMAILFLFVLMLCALGVGVYDLIANIPMQPIITLVLGAGIGNCLTILGLNHGIDSINGAVGTTITKTISGMLDAQSDHTKSNE